MYGDAGAYGTMGGGGVGGGIATDLDRRWP